MKIIKGNLIEMAKLGHFDAIVHGANCFNTMGAGIAKGISSEFPEAYEADCLTQKGDKEKLGKLSLAKIERFEKEFVVINAYTQYEYGNIQEEREKRGNPFFSFADYTAIYQAFARIALKFPNKHVGLPMLGANLAGGDWEIIKTIINQIEAHSTVYFTLVMFDV